MLSVEDWAEIRRLSKSEGLSINEIVRQLGVARNTVRSALRSDEPPAYRRSPSGSIVDAVEPEIRRLLMQFPRMPATVIAERIGWDRSLTVLKDRVRELRPLYLPPDPAGRTQYRPGELAQWDLWFPPADIPLENGEVAKPPVIVGLTGYSRVMVAKMIPSREAHDILSVQTAPGQTSDTTAPSTTSPPEEGLTSDRSSPGWGHGPSSPLRLAPLPSTTAQGLARAFAGSPRHG